MNEERKSRLVSLVDCFVFTLEEIRKRELAIGQPGTAISAAVLVVANWLDEGAAWDAANPTPTPTVWDSEVLKPYIDSIQINLDVVKSLPENEVNQAKAKVLENVLEMLRTERP